MPLIECTPKRHDVVKIIGVNKIVKDLALKVASMPFENLFNAGAGPRNPEIK